MLLNRSFAPTFLLSNSGSFAHRDKGANGHGSNYLVVAQDHPYGLDAHEPSPVETSRMIGNTRMPWWTWASPLLAMLLLTLAMTDVVTPNAIFATFAGIA